MTEKSLQVLQSEQSKFTTGDTDLWPVVYILVVQHVVNKLMDQLLSTIIVYHVYLYIQPRLQPYYILMTISIMH